MKQSDVKIGGCYLTYICGVLAPVIVVSVVEPSRFDSGKHTRYRIRREESQTILSKSRTAAALREKPTNVKDALNDAHAHRDYGFC